MTNHHLPPITTHHPLPLTMHHHLPPATTCTKHLLPPANFLPPNTIYHQLPLTMYHYLSPTTIYRSPWLTICQLFIYLFFHLIKYLLACCLLWNTSWPPYLCWQMWWSAWKLNYCCVTWEFSVICVRLGSRITHILLYANFICFFLLLFFATPLSSNLNYLGWTQCLTDALWVTS